MLTFKAVLLVDVSYTTIHGTDKRILAGTSIGVCRIDTVLHSSDIRRAVIIEKPNTFIGSHEDDSFDLSPAEFRLVA